MVGGGGVWVCELDGYKDLICMSGKGVGGLFFTSVFESSCHSRRGLFSPTSGLGYV